jgi:hypothetical protein
MKFQSHSRIGLTVFVAASLLLGCGVQPAPTQEQTAALLHREPPLFVWECERLLNDCERLRRPRLRDACVWEVLRGECGHLPRGDAGRAGMDGPASVPEAGMRDAGSDVGRDSGICDPSKMSCNRDAGRDTGAHSPEAGTSDGAADVHADSGGATSGGMGDSSADVARDGVRSTDGAEDGGAGGDASVDAGQVSTCPGTTTPGPLPPVFNCTSRGQNCGGCLEALGGGGDTVCASCSTAQSMSNCLALLACLGTHDFTCISPAGVGVGVGSSTSRAVACFCSNASCSGGLNGLCASTAEAVAGTTDSAELLRQLQDPSTTVNRVVQEALRFDGAGGGGCEMFCGCL